MSKRLRLPLVLGPNGIQANAPTFEEVPGSYRPVTAGVVGPGGVLPGIQVGDPRLLAVTVEVDVPDDDVNAAGDALDPVKLRQRYPTHWMRGKWGN